ncbi:PNPOx family protein [Numidum massiliense]|nr:hypothetical protein [Numidum massiliense]
MKVEKRVLIEHLKRLDVYEPGMKYWNVDRLEEEYVKALGQKGIWK